MTRPARALALLSLAAAAASLAIPRPVHACDCALLGPTFHPPYVPEAFAAAVTTSEEVAGLTCRPARRGRLACTWTARYVLTRAVAGNVPLTFAYPTGADVVVRLDGVGAPSQLAPLARPGVRVFARLGWFWCHLLGTLDVYPAFRGAPPERLGSLMLQFGI